MYSFIPELNVGGVDSRTLFLNENNELQPMFYGMRIRIHDTLLNHRSGGGLMNRISPNLESVAAFDEKLYLAIKDLQKGGIPFDLLLTNYFAQPSDILDTRGTELLTFLNDKCKYCGVIVVRKDVAQMIKERFPNLRLKWSTTAYYRDQPKNHKEYINELTENFDVVVLPTEINRNYKLLESLNHPDRVELMVFDNCYLGCPYRKQHYTLICLNNFKYANNQVDDAYTELEAGFCNKVYKANTHKPPHTLNLVVPQDISKLLKIGVKRFKIASRTFEGNELAFYVERIRSVLIDENKNASVRIVNYLDELGTIEEMAKKDDWDSLSDEQFGAGKCLIP